MVSSVVGKGFKGLPDFETKLDRMTLLCGPNGAGKTARTQALTLAILGQVPGIAKTNPQIMATFGNGEKLVVEVRRNGVRCSRGYFAQASGQVTEKFQLDLKKATRDQYAVALGGVKLFDLGAFQKLSDQGKIDQVFSLFPPGENYQELEAKIEAKKQERNALQKGIETLQATQARIHQAKVQIELPSGTLAEIKEQIQEAETQLSMARQLAEQHKVDIVKAEARKRAEEEAARQAEREQLRVEEKQRIEQARLEAQARANAENEVYARHQAELQAERERVLDEIDKAVPAPDNIRPVPEVHNDPGLPEYAATPWMIAVDIHESALRSILATMERTGCGACAASLVCRRELRKLAGQTGKEAA